VRAPLICLCCAIGPMASGPCGFAGSCFIRVVIPRLRHQTTTAKTGHATCRSELSTRLRVNRQLQGHSRVDFLSDPLLSDPSPFFFVRFLPSTQRKKPCAASWLSEVLLFSCRFIFLLGSNRFLVPNQHRIIPGSSWSSFRLPPQIKEHKQTPALPKVSTNNTLRTPAFLNSTLLFNNEDT